ncbi:hypothetical protein KUF71_000336 [Frankliniella fusca]|uniref:Uncharacterized protein n=1 Tax=Frankliniella fusca TaxID=407009 RepID=A0AAE1LLS0_9NEOP|nr:hypothetical protein KUF71_000336 [Frankliniella fusca]
MPQSSWERPPPLPLQVPPAPPRPAPPRPATTRPAPPRHATPRHATPRHATRRAVRGPYRRGAAHGRQSSRQHGAARDAVLGGSRPNASPTRTRVFAPVGLAGRTRTRWTRTRRPNRHQIRHRPPGPGRPWR